MLRYLTPTHVAWRCEECLTVHQHPHAHVQLHYRLDGVLEDTYSITCPACGAVESIRHTALAHPAHPDLWMGRILEGGNIVSEHHIGGLTEWQAAQHHLRAAAALRDILLAK